MNNPAPNTMPMAAAAQSVMGKPPIFPPPMPAPAGGAMPPSTPPAMPSALPAPAMGLPAMPAPSAPAQPPYQVSLQADGSSKYSIQTPNGEVVLGINPPPKMPKVFSQHQQAQQPIH